MINYRVVCRERSEGGLNLPKPGHQIKNNNTQS